MEEWVETIWPRAIVHMTIIRGQHRQLDVEHKMSHMYQKPDGHVVRQMNLEVSKTSNDLIPLHYNEHA